MTVEIHLFRKTFLRSNEIALVVECPASSLNDLNSRMVDFYTVSKT